MFTIGTLGVNTTTMVGLDIEQTPLLCPCNNTTLRTGAAFASLTAPGDSVSKLYTIDLKTGAATLQGTWSSVHLFNRVRATVPAAQESEAEGF